MHETCEHACVHARCMDACSHGYMLGRGYCPCNYACHVWKLMHTRKHLGMIKRYARFTQVQEYGRSSLPAWGLPDGVGSLPLQRLDVFHCEMLKDVSTLSAGMCMHLQHLDLRLCGAHDLSPLGACTCLLVRAWGRTLSYTCRL